MRGAGIFSREGIRPGLHRLWRVDLVISELRSQSGIWWTFFCITINITHREKRIQWMGISTLLLVRKRSSIPGNEARLWGTSKRNLSQIKWIINLLQFFQRFPRSLNMSYIKNWLTTLKIYFIKYMLGYRKYHGRPTALLFLTEQCKKDLDKHNISSAQLPFIWARLFNVFQTILSWRN